MKIFIASPSQVFTGGPTLAHQLCKCLSNNGYDAYMYYYGAKKGVNPVHKNYIDLNLPFVTTLNNVTKNDLLILPEASELVWKKYTAAQKVIWWMSVDNYWRAYFTSRVNRLFKMFGFIKNEAFQNSNYHLVQSEYAWSFLLSHGVSKDRIIYLSDYLDDIFLAEELDDSGEERENIIVYSPKRGLEFTKQIISLLPEYNFVPLQNMTQQEMISAMKRSKLYIDFGNHPGKDRIPREAAMCGCCVITGKQGSARNDIDVSIDKRFKFDEDNDSLAQICQMIKIVMSDYETYTHMFDEYRKKIRNEKVVFTKDAKKAIDILQKAVSGQHISK